MLPKMKFRSLSTSSKKSPPSGAHPETPYPPSQEPLHQEQQHATKKQQLTLDTTAQPLPQAAIKPTVQSSEWQVRYDPALAVYYYINTRTNETQFDHPDEVKSPLNSPLVEEAGDHRKLFKTGLKRTLSPKLFTTCSASSAALKKRDQSPTAAAVPKGRYDYDDDEDEDVEEFKKEFSREIQSYESERMRQSLSSNE